MVRQGKVAIADGQAWGSRRQDAQAFRKAAETLEAVAEEGQNCNPIIVLIIHAAIAYGDALTARFGGTVNRGNHDDLWRRVKQAMKGRADEPQISRLKDLLGNKTAYSYGAKIGRLNDMREMLKQLKRFELWAEEQLTSG
ncbi:MAG: hypothetical protein K2R93_16050 [Gemmatimonadaceae bacterium]|nr:hypothetical protein [Gemmatimonadaceae bacterium]